MKGLTATTRQSPSTGTETFWFLVETTRHPKSTPAIIECIGALSY